jgi:hypothetical protein
MPSFAPRSLYFPTWPPGESGEPEQYYTSYTLYTHYA